MKTLLRQTNRGIDLFNRLIGWGLAGLLLVMTVLIFWQVFARFVVGRPLYFSDEIARFAMIWLTFIGAGYAYRKGLMISVDIVLEFAGPRLARVMRVLVVLASALFAFILVKYGFEMVGRVANQTAPSTRVSMMWPYLAVPLGGIVILVNSVALLIDEVTGHEKEERG
ncbi:TRAP transporter small permease [Halomonas daqingensis]|uniref:TRAP transporter small permease protein n=1 Tax=Billgrantia desiderata TaxID=52021 RepID=A0AAW4YT71_9GAMM|nr:TRAP transporter small permease [Halomonas desiderata]MCE8012002.1 TRAP transporter small permease [Halomonas desiderata]MCE8029123.1 TRAP transporter small permease [Halomonas desiderata]MCE8041627.1 TRAP transporter small permease [Halomonas desiderata]MCE8046202.1 TRAP transporter small permease [Halomonas desiderata]MCE8051818.1 TRAP transporter small permease [Halomonas desiderata]